MPTLMTLPSAFGLPTASPFGLKAIALLNIAGVPFDIDTAVDCGRTSLQSLPYLKDGTRLVADSANIESHLNARHGAKFDHGLTLSQRTLSHSIKRMVEEHLYFAIVWNRWLNPAIWPQTRLGLFPDLTPPVRMLMLHLIRRQLRRDLNGQGMGRLSENSIRARASIDLAVLANALNARFLFGDRPTSADASVGAFLATLLSLPEECKLRQDLMARPRLVDYAETFRTDILGVGVSQPDVSERQVVRLCAHPNISHAPAARIEQDAA